MALTAEQFEQQKKQAEEMLVTEHRQLGFAKSLFFGRFVAPLVFPYPQIKAAERPLVEAAVAEFHKFAGAQIDSFAIDREAAIPRHVIDGLARLGILGMTAPVECGGRGFSQLGYCKVMEAVGSVDAALAVFVNAHHSIGIRALLLFGSEEQQRRWVPDLVTGKHLGAFALTEPDAGSDAANVQTQATPSPDGAYFLLNGGKRYITNGGIAQMLTVMARTPVPGKTETKVTAFLVTPDMPGFEVLESNMPKCGIRGTQTARLAFHDMPVPRENILGEMGKGLRIALTVLDFGRTTFGASCTGAAKTCLNASIAYAKTRVQFKQTLSEFELVKKKIAYMAAHAFAMEAMTNQCAAFIDSGAEDYMLETAMLKVFSTEALWQIVNDTIQIHGGMAYFKDQPFERLMRDARINQIGEGANDVLRAFIAAMGLREVGEHLKGVLNATRHPWRDFGTLLEFGKNQLSARFQLPDVPVQNEGVRREARELSRRVRDFGLEVQKLLLHFRKLAQNDPSTAGIADEETRIARQVFKRQYLEERLADAACDLYASACTLSRLDSLLQHADGRAVDNDPDVIAGRYFLRLANRRIHQNLAALSDNEDDWTTLTADAVLGKK
jgi:alkylation response protein AidB-like acyl-CoA dehydrogenase